MFNLIFNSLMVLFFNRHICLFKQFAYYLCEPWLHCVPLSSFEWSLAVFSMTHIIAHFGSVTLQPKVVQRVQQHVSYEFIWLRRTCDYV